MYSADCPKCKQTIFYIYLSLVSTNIDKVLEKRDIDEDDDYAVDEEFDPIINKKFCKWRLCPFLFREF